MTVDDAFAKGARRSTAESLRGFGPIRVSGASPTGSDGFGDIGIREGGEAIPSVEGLNVEIDFQGGEQEDVIDLDAKEAKRKDTGTVGKGGKLGKMLGKIFK